MNDDAAIEVSLDAEAIQLRERQAHSKGLKRQLSNVFPFIYSLIPSNILPAQ